MNFYWSKLRVFVYVFCSIIFIMKFSLLDYEKLREDFNQLNVGLQAFNFSMFNQRNYLKATFLT